MASSKKARKSVKKAMTERKEGTLKSGKSGRTVKSRKQAVAIGLSKARKAGAKVPKKKAVSKKKTAAAPKKKAATKKKATAKRSVKKTTKTTKKA
jgi:hypothetical protein